MTRKDLLLTSIKGKIFDNKEVPKMLRNSKHEGYNFTGVAPQTPPVT